MPTKKERNKKALDAIHELIKKHGVAADKRNKRNGYFKGKALRIPISVQARFVGPIDDLVAAMVKETEEQITELMKADYAVSHFQAMAGDSVGMDAPSLASQIRMLMNKLKAKFTKQFSDLAAKIVPDFAESINRSSSTATAGSAAELPNLKLAQKTLSLSTKNLDEPTRNILKTTTNRSADFIKTIPTDHLQSISDKVYDSIMTGNGMQDLVPVFEAEGNSIKNWAHNTAMDQTRKAYNGLNAGRMKKLGVTRGEWIHSGGSQHPRELHIAFNGQTFDLSKGAPVGDDDGNYVMPGDDPNCRCTFAPVVDLGEDTEDDGEDDE